MHWFWNSNEHLFRNECTDDTWILLYLYSRKLQYCSANVNIKVKQVVQFITNCNLKYLTKMRTHTHTHKPIQHVPTENTTPAIESGKMTNRILERNGNCIRPCEWEFGVNSQHDCQHYTLSYRTPCCYSIRMRISLNREKKERSTNESEREWKWFKQKKKKNTKIQVAFGMAKRRKIVEVSAWILFNLFYSSRICHLEFATIHAYVSCVSYCSSSLPSHRIQRSMYTMYKIINLNKINLRQAALFL